MLEEQDSTMDRYYFIFVLLALFIFITCYLLTLLGGLETNEPHLLIMMTVTPMVRRDGNNKMYYTPQTTHNIYVQVHGTYILYLYLQLLFIPCSNAILLFN